MHADVFDAEGNRLGDGPVANIISAATTCALDAAGTWVMTCAADKRALDLLQSERRVNVYIGGRRLVQGIIRKRTIIEAATGVMLQVEGPDILDELKRRNVLLGRGFANETLQSVCDTLIGLVPGWTIDVDAAIAGNRLNMRLDGVSVLKAFQELFPRYGYHFRLGANKQLVVGRFGQASGYRAHAIRWYTEEASDELVIVQQLTEEADTENLINRLYLQGAGEGTAALTLEGSTRSAPYPIKELTGPDGQTQRYIEDADSIASYGRIEKFVQFKEIGALSNSQADIRHAANALYDAGAAHLGRYAAPYRNYSVVLRNAKSLQIGDTIHLDYKAEVETVDGAARYFDLRGDFWIMECDESVGSETLTSLRIANVDRPPDTAAARVQSAIESVQARDLKPSLSTNTRTFVYEAPVSENTPARFPLRFSDATRELLRVNLYLKTRPLTVNATTVATADATTTADGGSDTTADGGVDTTAGGGATIGSLSGATTSSEHSFVPLSGGGETTESGGGTMLSGGGVTSNDGVLAPLSGGGVTSESATIPQVAAPATTSSDGGTRTSKESGNHRHKMFDHLRSGNFSGTAARLMQATSSDSQGRDVAFWAVGQTAGEDLYTKDSAGRHRHDIDPHSHIVQAHTHDIEPHAHVIPDHTHDIQAHDHTIPDHTHPVDPHIHVIPDHTHNIPAHRHTIPAHRHSISSHVHSIGNHRHSIGNHSHEIAGHSHAVTFGLMVDTALPRNVRVFLNGTDRTALLFDREALATGERQRLDASGNSGALANQLYKEAGGLRREHTLEVRAEGQGTVELTIEIFEITQAIALPLNTANVIIS